MPSALMTLDTSRPTFTGRETTEQKVEALENYTYMLLENLRYILRNLTPENLNEAEMVPWVEEHSKGAVITDSLITNELYAQYGDIADLVVDRLRTDWKRARCYLYGDTGDINYIFIHDEVIEYTTARVTSTTPVQLNRFERDFWWTTDPASTPIEALRMTSLQATAWPVMVYQYDELVKAKIEFQPVGDTWFPVFQFGAGGTGETAGRNIGRVSKDPAEFDILLTNNAGDKEGLKIHAAGGAEAPGLLWFGTQAQYDALTRNAYTTYFIEEASTP